MKATSRIKAIAGSVKTLLDSELEPEVGYIGPPLVIPYFGVCLMGGLPKIGKSWLTLEIMRSLASGEPLFGNKAWKVPEPVRVMYIEQELGSRSLKGRMSCVFDGLSDEVLDRMSFVSKNDHVFDLNDQEHRDYLRAYIDSKRPSVVIVDPLQEMHSAEENDATAMGLLGHYLKRLVNEDFKEEQMSLMITHHFRKPPNDRSNWDALDPNNFRGSGRLYGAPDSVLTFHRCEEIVCSDDPQREAWRIQGRMKLRHSESPKDYYLRFNEYGDQRMVWEGYMGAEQKEPESEAKPGVNKPGPRFIAS